MFWLLFRLPGRVFVVIFLIGFALGWYCALRVTDRLVIYDDPRPSHYPSNPAGGR